MMLEHESSPGNPRCIHCGTLFANHAKVPQPCVPRWSGTEALRPEPARREYAIDDIETIHARLVELEADRRAVLYRPAEDEEIPF
jgi:hypothetical protein